MAAEVLASFFTNSRVTYQTQQDTPTFEDFHAKSPGIGMMFWTPFSPRDKNNRKQWSKEQILAAMKTYLIDYQNVFAITLNIHNGAKHPFFPIRRSQKGLWTMLSRQYKNKKIIKQDIEEHDLLKDHGDDIECLFVYTGGCECF